MTFTIRWFFPPCPFPYAYWAATLCQALHYVKVMRKSRKQKGEKKNHCLHFHSFGSVFFLELPSLSWWSGHKAQYMVVNHQTAGREEGYLVIHREQTSHLILNVCPDLAYFSQSKTLYQRGAYHDSHVWILISSKNISTSKTGSEQI